MKKKSLGIIVLLSLLMLAAIFTVLGTAQIHTSEILYDGTTIRWNKVPFAQNYSISINGSDPILCEEACYTYPNGGDFSVEITVHKAVFSDMTEQKNFRYLQTVEGLQFQDGVLYWNPVKDADSYTIEVNGKVVATVTETRFVYDGAQDAIFRVKPNSSNQAYYALWSTPYSAYILPTPQNVQYDHATHTILWDAVAHASSYTVWVDNRPYVTNTNSMHYESNNATFTVQVQANGDRALQFFDSLRSQVKTYTYLPAVANLRVQDGIVIWDHVDGATGYRVVVNGEEQAQTSANFYADLTPNTAYTVKVLPINADPNAYSDWQTTDEFAVLPTPILSAPSFAGGQVNVSWARVENANGYTLQISRDGVLLPEVYRGADGAPCAYGDAFTEAGVYTLRLCASPNGGKSASAWSNEITVIRLAKPQNVQIAPDGTVTFAPSVKALSYTVKVNGQTAYSALSANTFSLSDGTVTQNGDLDLEIFANGGQATESSIILPSLESATATAHKAGNVNGVQVSASGVTWNATAGASRYWVLVSHNNGTPQRHEVTGTSFDCAWSEVGTYHITVQAVMDGANTVPSNPATTRDVVVLTAPTVRVDHYDNCLHWDYVNGATEYEIWVDGDYKTTVSQNKVSLMNYASSQIQRVSVKAVSLGALVLGNSSSELKFALLNAPSEVYVNNETITWTAVTGATGYEISIDGAPFSSFDTSYDHDGKMSAAGSHTVRVKAVREDSEVAYLAAWSGNVTVIRLPKPSKPFGNTGTSQIRWDLPSVPTSSWEKVQLWLDGEVQTLTSDYAGQFDLPTMAVGVHAVQVQFIGSGDASLTKTGTISSERSEYYRFEVKKIATPTADPYRIGSGTLILNAIPYNIDNTYLKCIFVCGGETPYYGGQGVFDHTFYNVEANVDCRVKIVGGFFLQGVYYCDSDWSSTVNG